MKKIPVRKLNTSSQVSATAESFKIRRLQDIVGDKDMVHDLHRHDFFFVLVVQHGKGEHIIDFTPYPISDNIVFILRPGQVHELKLMANCTGYLMEFSTGFYYPAESSAGQRLRKAAIRNYIAPVAERVERLMHLMDAMLREASLRENDYKDAIKAALDIFFIECTRVSAVSPGSVSVSNAYVQERFETFLAMVEKHITDRKQVALYAALMNLSPYQLNEITKSSVGKTASEIINEHIILEAKRYLLATTNQVKDIADLLGYEDISYFIRFFKKHTGKTPELFRQHSK
jgi:AraC family transcriptional regulator, transcriptional activator of pobA